MSVIVKEPKKRIAIFLPGLYDGGAQRVMFNLAGGFISHGFDVDIVLVQAEGPYLSEVPSSVRLVELNTKHLSGQRTLYSIPSLVSYMRREKLVAMLSSLNYVNVVALWAKRLAGVSVQIIIFEHKPFSSR